MELVAEGRLAEVFAYGYGLVVKLDRPEWSGLRAVRNGRVALTDGNQFFNRPGPRLVESAEILAEIFHPEAFDFGHKGSDWAPWPAAQFAI